MVGVLLGILLRNLLRDLLLVTECVLVANLRHCFGLNEPAPLQCKCSTKCLSLVVEWLSSVVLFGLPTAFPCGHRCDVGIDRDPPMCLDAQGGIKAKRQPFCGWCCLEVMWSWTSMTWSFCQMLELRMLTICELL